jgi:hypothetical protein
VQCISRSEPSANRYCIAPHKGNNPQDRIAHLRKIAITNEVEVNEGVKNGDQVILQPPVNLADGDKVHIIPEPQAATP